MNWKSEGTYLVLMVGVFLACFYLPVGNVRFDNAIMESLHLVKWYAQEHVLLCLIPAFFIAGAISVFVSQASVMKYLGAKANKVLAYGVASVSGSILAVCSCTILPLFVGIYKMGAGLGPATAFLYAGPAINVLAIILTARILGVQMGIARAVGAVVFSVIIGLCMHMIFRNEESEKAAVAMAMPDAPVSRPLWKNALYFASMIGILVFANWARSGDIRAVFLCCPNGLHTYQVEGTLVEQNEETMTIMDPQGQKHEIGLGLVKEIGEVQKRTPYELIYPYRWIIVAVFLMAFIIMVTSWFNQTERLKWVQASWGFAKQILPLLLGGVLIAGFLLGRAGAGHEGIIPTQWIERAVGGNTIRANLFAAIAGAFMYFATLTEVPILQGLMGSGMGKGPALALLLAGPALSLPHMLVIRSVMGTKKTLVFVMLVVVMATLSGTVFGAFF